MDSGRPSGESRDPGAAFRAGLQRLDSKKDDHIVSLVDWILEQAHAAGASDVHIQPGQDLLLLRWRIAGVLHDVATLPGALGKNVAARLKVMSDLLTYQTDTPQEGRIRGQPRGFEQRVSTFPTLFGEKVVVRLFAEQTSLRYVDDLGLPQAIARRLRDALCETSGAIVISGPAGTGKTTTLYACLRELQRHDAGARNIASLEDPIESVVAGVAQSQVNTSNGFDLANGLRALMRQDPEVIAIGEMRDRVTAEAALGASLTGHLILTTFHAPGAAGVIGRLLDMGLEPYVLRSGLRAILAQRLFRRLCDCSAPEQDDNRLLGLPVAAARRAVGCTQCAGTGYRDRFVLAELLDLSRRQLAEAVLARRDVRQLAQIARDAGMLPLDTLALQAVECGLTTPLEVRRVLGFGNEP